MEVGGGGLVLPKIASAVSNRPRSTGVGEGGHAGGGGGGHAGGGGGSSSTLSITHTTNDAAHPLPPVGASANLHTNLRTASSASKAAGVVPPKATMRVSDTSRKLGTMVWGRSWSDKKHKVREGEGAGEGEGEGAGERG